jgi:hypothetical protein
MSHETYSDGWSEFCKDVKNFFVILSLYILTVSVAHTKYYKQVHSFVGIFRRAV